MDHFFMGFDPLFLCGLTAAMLSIIAYVPYIRDTLWFHTKPQRASWLIWSVLSSISFASQLVEGASTSLLFAGAQLVGTFMVFLTSIRNGHGGYLSHQDGAVIAAAGFGIVFWFLTENAVYALGISITVSFLGGFVTIRKAYDAPHSETKSKWLVSLVASLFAIASVGTLDWVLLAYPLYLVALNVGILGAMALGALAGKGQTAKRPTKWQGVSQGLRAD